MTSPSQRQNDSIPIMRDRYVGLLIENLEEAELAKEIYNLARNFEEK